MWIKTHGLLLVPEKTDVMILKEKWYREDGNIKILGIKIEPP